MNNTERIPFNFTYYAMKLLGKNLYSNPWTALSEIVANSIDAGANNVYVLIDMHNKEHSAVEIFDDGAGMSYDDLEKKYTLIGRNKRLDSDNNKGKTLGRKGIGKLAALYLSPKYYLLTKNGDETSAWMVDTFEIKDSDIPALINTEYNTSVIVARDMWDKIKTGTMIHLSDVDLRKIGSERLKSLSLILSDYYLDTYISTKIWICIINDSDDSISFNTISKSINFNTLYGIFDNTEYGYKNKLQPKVFVTKPNADQEVDYPRETIVLDEEKYNFDKNIEMDDIDGKKRTVSCEMKGWIGIHSSLDASILDRNSKGSKRIQFHPNALRLYVRGKLAINNLMNYINSSAAFANYIEGEISFDVLDDDDLEDASTSNREGYSVNDPRIKVLLDIVGKIVNSLISERNKIGNTINKELDEIKKRKEQEAAEERRKREEAEEQVIAAKEEVEKETENRIKAEVERDAAVKENKAVTQRLFVLENNFTSDGEKYKHGLHLAINFAKEIRSVSCDFDELIKGDRKQLISSIMEIDRSAAKIEKLPNIVDSATFSLDSPQIELDLLELIKDYIETKANKRLKYSFNIEYTIKKEIDFPDIIMLLENIISNSIKAKAHNLTIHSHKTNNKCQIDFIDDGLGINPKYENNPQKIFELGESTTPGGYGIGAFHIKEIVNKLGGSVSAIPMNTKGLTIRMVI